MKKLIYALIIPLVMVSLIVFAKREIKNETTQKPTPKPLTADERSAEREKWEASPDGIKYLKWKESPAGEKVLGSAAKILKHTTDFSNMEAVITSLSLPPGSRLGFGVMVRINDEDYILMSGGKELQQLRSLKVNDKIIIRSHAVSHAPRYAYAIISGDYIERDGKIIYERPPGEGC